MKKVMIIAITIVALLACGCSGGIKEKTATESTATSGDQCVFAEIPGETDLVYVIKTNGVYIYWTSTTHGGFHVDGMAPFTPKYGYSGIHVYYLPEENKLVNENGEEVPGIKRDVGDRPEF
ncbi:MAG: hypothetical protein K5837_04315 [Candidatus Saccharibacteria bacterium]|nr:hypothetical protein [Candidatus Saccharibacteria bacterium]